MIFEAFYRPAHFAAPALGALLLAVVFASAACASAAPDKDTSPGPLCGAGMACADASSCIASRCRAPNALPAPAWSKRVRLAPSELALLSPSDSSGEGSELPAAFAPGRPGSSNSLLLFRFASEWQDRADIASAFLVLEPAPGATPRHASSRVQMARILEPWKASTATWGRQPRLSLPEDAGWLSSAPLAAARIDVTKLVREWAKRRPDDHGIALLIEGNAAYGARYSMGISDGPGPMLEVYLR